MNDAMMSKAEKEPKEGIVHLVLSHSYVVFFLAVLLGVLSDMIIPINIFGDQLFVYLGLAMIVVGPILVYWAQSSSAIMNKKITETGVHEPDFEYGPYKYSRNPTHIGLSIMVLGFSFLISSVFSVIFTIITSIVTKMIFLRREESLLEKKYGQPYLDYKKKVGTWI